MQSLILRKDIAACVKKNPTDNRMQVGLVSTTAAAHAALRVAGSCENKKCRIASLPLKFLGFVM